MRTLPAARAAEPGGRELRQPRLPIPASARSSAASRSERNEIPVAAAVATSRPFRILVEFCFSDQARQCLVESLQVREDQRRAE